MTTTSEKAIDIAPIIGLSNPNAATGIAITLYINAQKKILLYGYNNAF